MKKSKIIGVLALILMLIVTLAGCSTPAATTAAPAATTAAAAPAATEAPQAKLSGQVIIDGSGTVYPLMAHLAEEYMTNLQSGVSVQVGRAGTSAGFKKFVVGETDFSDASRPIKSEELDALKASGYTEDQILEIKIALDGLTMVINNENTWATEMTRDEIVNMYLAGHHKADDVVLWSDIRPEWPAEEVKFFGPNENHGTYEFFYEVILKKQDMVKTANLQQEYSTLVDLVSKDKNAIAFFGFGYYVNNQDKIKAVSVDFGNGPVAPALDTIGEDLAYAGFTRPVFTYLNLKHAQDKPELLDYAKFVVSADGAAKLAGENGFAPLPMDVYNSYMKVLEGL
jgi:phosphate transport system substrate-binding protein